MTDTHPDDARPWRKRRPVFSRVVLYALGALLVGVLAVLWSQRSGEDEQDRIDVLRKRLRGLPSTLIPIPDGHEEILRILGTDDFTDEDLPDDVKSLVERTRAMALRISLSDPTKTVEVLRGVDAALALAKRLAPAEELQAVHLEWAEARIEMGTSEGVADLLDDPAVKWTSEPARILRNYLQAAILVEDGQSAAAATHMETFLASLKAPLSLEETIEVGGRPWSSAQTAVTATSKLASIRAGQNDPRIWERLTRLAPTLCMAHVRAAAGLASMGLEERALSSWKRALEVDEAEATQRVERDVILRDLKKLLEKNASSLKSSSTDGR